MSGPDHAPLHYLEFGSPDSAPVFVAHGLYGDATSMGPLSGALAARGLRVFAVDALGHGRSPRPDGFTLRDQGHALNALIAHLGYKSAAVVGVSMGSYVAAQAATLEPARISHLVLVVSKARGATSSTLAYAEREGFDIARATMEETLEFLAGALWSPVTSPERRAQLSAPPSDAPPALSADERRAVDQSLVDFDLTPGLPSISAQTLVISGRSDGLNPPDEGKAIAGLIPGAVFEVYEDSGHMLAFEEQDHLVDDVVQLLAT